MFSHSLSRCGRSRLASLFTTLLFPAIAFASPSGSVDVTKGGVVGDGVTLDTVAIQKTIDDCSVGGGGTVPFPPGRYLTGTARTSLLRACIS